MSGAYLDALIGLPTVNIVRKLVAGGPGRPTRLHTERGELIPARELRHIPRACFEKAMVALTGTRPDQPWWPMSVIPVIESHLTSSSTVIEFGSGSSTIWLAKRARTVTSIEDNPQWHATVVRRLNGLGLENAVVQLADGPEYYMLSDQAGLRFDLAVIDGSYRWKCVKAVLPLMKPGGIVYLDNSDADKDLRLYPDPTMRHAAQAALQAYVSATPGCTLRRYVSVISGELHAGEGMVLLLPQSPA